MIPGLTADFEAPARQAQLDILLLLARCLHEHRLKLYGASEDWPRDLDRLAHLFGELITEAREREAVLMIWRSFVAGALISASSATQAVLAAVEDRLSALLASGSDAREYLATANERAHARMRELLRAGGLEYLLPRDPVPVEIFWDPDAGYSCALAARSTRDIRWAFQARPHALWGALVSEHVFAHEYLSHLAPRSGSLSRQVREGWLMETLVHEIRNNAHSPHGERTFDTIALMSFRDQIARSVSRDPFSLYSSAGIRDVVYELYRSPAPFWRLTGEMLREEGDDEWAERLDRVLKKLAGLAYSELRQVARSEWSGLEALAACLEQFS